MLKLVLKEPVPDGLHSPKNFVTQEGKETSYTSVPAEYARTMQSFFIEGEVADIEEMVMKERPYPMDDTWFSFTKKDGKRLTVPGSNIAYIEEV